MKYAIFGTGKYYSNFKKYLNENDILFFIDNDSNKWGKNLDGKQICSPLKADYQECDFVLIMIMNYQEIKKQLLSYGISENKIKTYYDIPEIFDIMPKVFSNRGNNTLDLWKDSHTRKTVFVCSHNFSRTGVPIALMNLCILLKKMGYDVLLSALVGGTLERELSDNNIDYCPDLKLFYKSNKFLDIIKKFDIVMLGSLVLSEVGCVLAPLNIPILWWLHESEERLYKEFKLIIKENIHFFAGGKRVIEKFKKYYPDGNIDEMLYFLPDVNEEDKDVVRKEKITFALIGTVSYRKAQDIYVRAIEQMEWEKIDDAEFIMVGKYNVNDNFIDIPSIVRNNDHIKWIDELSAKEISILYNSVDVLVCPSRDDPMPIVVTQALQRGIPCIVSDEVGQSEYLINSECGMVVPSEDVEALAEAMTRYIREKDKIKENAQAAKNIFNQYFLEEKMKIRLEEIFNKLT